MKKYSKAFEAYWLRDEDPILLSDWEAFATYHIKHIAYNFWMAGRRYEKKMNLQLGVDTSQTLDSDEG